MKRMTALTGIFTAINLIPVYASEVKTVTPQRHGPFDTLVSAIYNSYLFQRYISTWGAPLNNASFLAVLLIVCVLLMIASGVELFLNYKKSQKILKANEEKIEKRRQQEAEDALLREYMRFKMLAETNDIADAQNVSFEQWLAARVDSGQVEMSSLTPKQQEAITEAKEVASDIKEAVTDKLNQLNPKNKPVDEEAEMDAHIEKMHSEDENIRKAREYEKKQAEELAKMREANGDKEETPAANTTETKTTEPDKKAVNNWSESIEEIKRKYNSGPKATELVDLPDADDTVPLSKAAIVKPIAPKEKPVVKEEKKEKIDVNRLLQEKTEEMKDDMGSAVTFEEKSQFEQIVASLNLQRQAESMAKALSDEAEKAKEANIEILKSDLEDSIDGIQAQGNSKKSASSDNKALEEAKKKALKEQEREKKRKGK